MNCTTFHTMLSILNLFLETRSCYWFRYRLSSVLDGALAGALFIFLGISLRGLSRRLSDSTALAGELSCQPYVYAGVPGDH
jgi:hypothetical protein